MKRLFASLVAMAMVLSLAACGGGGSSSKGASSAGGSSAGGSSAGGSSAAASTPAGSGSADASTPSGSGSAGGSAASGTVTPKDGGTELTFGTGGETGTYYAFGNVIGNKVGDMTSTTVTAIASGGSAANIQSLEAGDIQIALVQSDVMSYAFNGERSFDGAAYSDFSTVAALYMEQVQIITCNPDIKTVADLAGKTVSVGDQGSGVYFNAVDILNAYDIDIETGIKPTYQGFGDSAEALKDGQIDAAFVVAGAPTTAVTDLAAAKDIYLVSLDDEHIDKLTAESPFYSKNVISKDTYGTEEDCTTVAMSAVVIANDSVSDADVYNFLVGTFEDIPNLSHDKAKELSLEFASSVTSVGYHPGAVAYFADKGITVKGK